MIVAAINLSGKESLNRDALILERFYPSAVVRVPTFYLCSPQNTSFILSTVIIKRGKISSLQSLLQKISASSTDRILFITWLSATVIEHRVEVIFFLFIHHFTSYQIIAVRRTVIVIFCEINFEIHSLLNKCNRHIKYIKIYLHWKTV